MPDIPFFPFWAEIIVWVIAGGIVVNLLVWFGAEFQLARHEKRRVEYVGENIGVSVFWFLVWPFLIYEMVVGKTKWSFPLHLIGAALGIEASLRQP